MRMHICLRVPARPSGIVPPRDVLSQLERRAGGGVDREVLPGFKAARAEIPQVEACPGRHLGTMSGQQLGGFVRAAVPSLLAPQLRGSPSCRDLLRITDKP